jgi:6-phosphogluconolactonase (cycloisomerase 2 family)
MGIHRTTGLARGSRLTGKTVILLFLGMLALGASACSDNHSIATQVPSTPVEPSATITPGWTIPSPPNATVGQGYTASVPIQDNCSYLWTVTAGSATLINETTATVTFTPTAAGSIELQCVVTSAASATGTYAITAADGAVLNANPDTVTDGQGTILLPTFTGTSAVINPGAIPVTSGVGVAVTPSATTTYILRVDGADVATINVNVMTFGPRFVYVASDEGNIGAYTLDTTTGGLEELEDSPYSAYSFKVASDPSGRFLFSSDVYSGVSVYFVDNVSGALTLVEGSPFVTDDSSKTYNIAVDPMGRFVYATCDSGNVYGFRLNPVTGVLTEIDGSPFATGDIGLGDILVHPSGKYLYLALAGDGQVDAFSIDQATGALARIEDAPYDTGVTTPLGVAVDPTGAYLFAKGESAPSMMAGYSVDIGTGALTPVANSPFGPFIGSDSWHGLSFHPTKSILYNSFYGSDEADVGAQSLDLATGALTPMAGSPYSLFEIHGSDCITIDRSGRFAFAVNYDGGLLARMRVDSNGLLTKLNGDPLGDLDVDTTYVVDYPISVVVVGGLTPKNAD